MDQAVDVAGGSGRDANAGPPMLPRPGGVPKEFGGLQVEWGGLALVRALRCGARTYGWKMAPPDGLRTACTCTCTGSGMGTGTRHQHQRQHQHQQHAPAPAPMPATTHYHSTIPPALPTLTTPHRPPPSRLSPTQTPPPSTALHPVCLCHTTPHHTTQAVLEHMARAPTPASRVDVMAAMVHYLTQDGEGVWEVGAASLVMVMAAV